MVNSSSISGCGIIIQHYSLHIIAPVMVNFSSLGCSYVFIGERVSLLPLRLPIYHHCMLPLPGFTNVIVFRNSIFFRKNPMDSQRTIATTPIWKILLKEHSFSKLFDSNKFKLSPESLAVFGRHELCQHLSSLAFKGGHTARIKLGDYYILL